MKQRSTEWAQARRGKITASRFGDVLASPETKRYQNYLQEVLDGLRGVPDFDDLHKPWFRHGRQWEDAARGEYEWERDVTVTQVGLIVHPDIDFIGCSPDGLVGDDGGVELKCCKVRAEFDNILTKKGTMREGYKPQVQGCMWVASRGWWDFFAFYQDEHGRASKPLRVERDEPYIGLLHGACLEFWAKVQEKL